MEIKEGGGRLRRLMANAIKSFPNFFEDFPNDARAKVYFGPLVNLLI